MNKIFLVALREFLATVATKGFIIGVLITPALIGMLIVVMPLLINERPPKVDGELALVDPTGLLLTQVQDYLTPEKIAERRGELKQRIEEATPEALRQLSKRSGSSAITEQATASLLGDLPAIRVVRLPADTVDLEAEKTRLHEGSIQEGGRLALAVVHEDAVRREPGGKYGSYDLYVRGKLDDRLEDELKGALRHAIVETRIRTEGLDPERIHALTDIERVRSTTVTEQGERQTNEIANILLPAGFMVLLLVSVFTSGQQIMTSTIEEKSSRVVELLLSAVSPLQLMTGKIVGQMCVGFLILALYSGMGIVALVQFAMLGVLDLSLLFYLFLFYLIAYFIVGSLMAAVGAAVNEVREAQTLMTPIMVTMMIPWMLWMPITRDPNSVFATVISFVPPLNTFVMLLRMTSTTPPPLWQVWLSILVGVASVYGALWFAAKVFRVGLLMFGKPPNFATLVRWVRMA